MSVISNFQGATLNIYIPTGPQYVGIDKSLKWVKCIMYKTFTVYNNGNSVTTEHILGICQWCYKASRPYIQALLPLYPYPDPPPIISVSRPSSTVSISRPSSHYTHPLLYICLVLGKQYLTKDKNLSYWRLVGQSDPKLSDCPCGNTSELKRANRNSNTGNIKNHIPN